MKILFACMAIVGSLFGCQQEGSVDSEQERDARISDLQKEVAGMQKANACIVIDVQKIKRENARLEQEWHKKSAEIEELKKKNEDLSKSLEEKQKKNAVLQEELEKKMKELGIK